MRLGKQGTSRARHRTLLTVRTRLMAAFGVAALFTVLASGIAIVAFTNARNAIDHITESHLQVVIAAHKLAERAQAVAAAAPTLIAAKAPSQRLTASTRIKDQLSNTASPRSRILSTRNHCCWIALSHLTD